MDGYYSYTIVIKCRNINCLLEMDRERGVGHLAKGLVSLKNGAILFISSLILTISIYIPLIISPMEIYKALSGAYSSGLIFPTFELAPFALELVAVVYWYYASVSFVEVGPDKYDFGKVGGLLMIIGGVFIIIFSRFFTETVWYYISHFPVVGGATEFSIHEFIIATSLVVDAPAVYVFALGGILFSLTIYNLGKHLGNRKFRVGAAGMALGFIILASPLISFAGHIVIGLSSTVIYLGCGEQLRRIETS